MANRNYLSSKVFSGHAMPIEIDMQFTVAVADSAGLGITSLKGPYVQNVFMHTSATPGLGNSNPATPGIAITNPNPASGTIVIQLQDSFSQLYGLDWSAIAPAGTPIKIDNAAMTAGIAYTITTLGNATAANWITVGVPAAITPAVGVTFICAANLAGNALTSRVAPSAAAGSAVMSIESLGNPTLSLVGLAASSLQGFGAQIILECRDAASALVAPADGSILGVKLLLSNSSVTVGGY